MLPNHGKIDCRLCFGNDRRDCTPHPAWKMVNDPGAWGSATPRYLVLGFSKGSTQADIYASGRFEEVAFAGMRDRLSQSLRHFGVLAPYRHVDAALADPRSPIAFGSLVRCSVARRDDKDGQYKCSGALVVKAFTDIRDVVDRCAERYLKNLPASVETVFLLGNQDGYVKGCRQVLARLYPDARQVNAMALRAGGKLWVHLGHPSGMNGHFENWLTGSSGKQAGKRQLAEQALALVR